MGAYAKQVLSLAHPTLAGFLPAARGTVHSTRALRGNVVRATSPAPPTVEFSTLRGPAPHFPVDSPRGVCYISLQRGIPPHEEPPSC